MAVGKTKVKVGAIPTPEPNWSNPVTERYSFRTSIIQSRNKIEQREAIRQRPRLSYSFTSDGSSEKGRKMMRELHLWPPSGLWYVPVPGRFVSLTAAESVASVVIDIDDDSVWWLQSGAYAVLSNDTTQELVQIDGVSAGSVTLTSGITTEFAAGDKLHLAAPARYVPDVSFNSLVSGHVGGAVTFDVDAGYLDTFPNTISVPVHEGYPVFLKKPDWGTAPQRDMSLNFTMVDQDYGVVEPWRELEHVSARLTYRLGLLHVSDLEYVLNFFVHRKGARGSFWMPTYGSEFEISSLAASDSTELEVDGVEYEETYDGDPVFNTVMIEWPDGAVQCNRIVSYATGASTTTLTVEDEWERDVETACRVCWVLWGRFTGDDLEIDWQTSTVGTTTLAFTALGNLPLNDAGPEYVTVVQENDDEANTSFEDPTDYTEVSTDYLGIPRDAIDHGYVMSSLRASGEGTTRPADVGLFGPTEPVHVIVRVQFRDENGDVLSAVSGEATVSSATENIWDRNLVNTLPPGCRYVRAIYSAVRWSPAFSDITEYEDTTLTLQSSRDWGLYEQDQVGDLYVP